MYYKRVETKYFKSNDKLQKIFSARCQERDGGLSVIRNKLAPSKLFNNLINVDLINDITKTN